MPRPLCATCGGYSGLLGEEGWVRRARWDPPAPRCHAVSGPLSADLQKTQSGQRDPVQGSLVAALDPTRPALCRGFYAPRGRGPSQAPRRWLASTLTTPRPGRARLSPRLADRKQRLGEPGPQGRGQGAAKCAQGQAPNSGPLLRGGAGQEAVGWCVRGEKPRGLPSEPASHLNTGQDPPGRGSAPWPGRAGGAPRAAGTGTEQGIRHRGRPRSRSESSRGVDTNP